MEIRNDENTLIETVTALAGLKIEIWTGDFQHALEEHPEVTLDRIKAALKRPGQIVQSKKSARTCLFYSIGIKDATLGTIYFCVVAGVTEPGKGKFEIAYEANFMKNSTVLFQKGETK